MSFLPTGYTRIPTNSDYMKFKDGENTFRVLSSAVIGYEYWNTQNKPVRSRERWDSIPDDIRLEKDGKPKINHFWAFVVWNYEESRVQLLEVTQKSVQSQMKAYVDNARWGDPKMYDITVTKSGAMFDTEYQTVANPPIAPADQKILDAYAKKPVNLNALFDTDGDPFVVASGAAAQPAVQPSAEDLAKDELLASTSRPATAPVASSDIPL
jgi:hypothetical protein